MSLIPKILIFLLAIVGALDAGYLTYEHFAFQIPPCHVGIFADCGKVLQSKYSVMFGVPLALIGLIHYILEAISIVRFKKLAVILSVVGFGSSLYFLYIMFFVLHAVCLYCLASALTSIILFILIPFVFARERVEVATILFALFYKAILKPVFFVLSPEFVHERMTHNGNLIGSIPATRKFFAYLFNYKPQILTQYIADIEFKSPIGLAAGFDYEAQLTQILPHMGFGFGTVGTITYQPYSGNPGPKLGRLPKSKSLMVNKGFKNLGADITIKNLSKKTFAYPVGISIGTRQGLEDLLAAFKKFEKSPVEASYYELNISCPNLDVDFDFYSPESLNRLLRVIDKLKLSKPVFIKMPIEKSNNQVCQMLDVIVKHKVTGVIFGNLQKNRNHPSLVQSEVAKFPKGNFSGKPCFDRSNELISLCYKLYAKRLVIIGCGGVFSPDDAYEKIKRGASLVQLITGMIYEGPQLIAHINLGLETRLARDGFGSLAEAVGMYNRSK